MEVQIQTPESFGKLMPSAFLPYGSFIIFLRITDKSVTFPLTVEIKETPNAPVGTTGLILSGCQILRLDLKTQIHDPFSLTNGYPVANLNNFEMKWPAISFKVKMNTEDAAIDSFKGSTMEIMVHNNSGYAEKYQVQILNSNPNNHFHWRKELKFLDGWFFKCVHVDNANNTATPFVFLYGVNNPAGGTGSESFIICVNGGTVDLDSNGRPVPGATPTGPDHEMFTFPISDFHDQRLYGLDIAITKDFTASDQRCRGSKELTPGETISWDLTFTKIHTHCRTDWNPLEPFETSLEAVHYLPPVYPDVFTRFPTMPLMKHFNSFHYMTAYYMSHNMNSFVSGTINWKGTKYLLDNVKGYQDGNWGSEGFPHPYVWMQANNFVSETGNLLIDTSLVALFTPKMPLLGFSNQALVGGICFRHKGKVYRFFLTDVKLLGMTGVAETLADMVHDIGPIDCNVWFLQAAKLVKVDMSDPDSVANTITRFEDRKTPAYPIRWQIVGRNDAGWMPGTGDKIEIEVTCDASTVVMLTAPYGGKMVPDVTKETLHGCFVVSITPNGGTTEKVYADFGTAEFGD